MSDQPLAAATYRVAYTYARSIFERVTTDIGAYSVEDATERVRQSLSMNDGVKILDVTRLGNPEPVTCTYEGGPGAVYPEGPWVFMDWVDRWAPVIVCDVHGHPAHASVYESSDPITSVGPERYHGPCEAFPAPPEQPRPLAKEGVGA